MINAKVVGDDVLIGKLRAIPNSVRARLMRSVTSLAIRVTSKVKFDKLSGQVLKVQTGRLRRSIKYQVVNNPSQIFATVGTNVEYARIHEYGGKSARQSIMPERSYLRSSLRELKGEIVSELGNSIKAGIKNMMR